MRSTEPSLGMAVISFGQPPTAPPAPPSISSNHAIAIAFARAGISVFPCASGTKAPLTARGFKDATSDERPIARWWRQDPGALVGLPTSCFWVLDIDAKPALADSMAALLELLLMDEPTLVAACALVIATPGGGLHLYFARTTGVAIRTGAGDIASGVDTRGHDADGRATGYIIAPGCVLPDGRAYRILKGTLGSLFAMGGRS